MEGDLNASDDTVIAACALYRVLGSGARVAAVLGLSESSVHRRLRLGGASKRHATDEEIVATYRRTQSVRATIAACRCTYRRIRDVLLEAGVPLRSVGAPVRVDLDRARALARLGYSHPEIAARLGVSVSTLVYHQVPADYRACKLAVRPHDWEQVVAWRADGLRWVEIARELGVSKDALINARRHYGGGVL